VVADLAEKIANNLREFARTETVVGKPVEAAGATIVPIVRVSIGFGAGGNESEAGDKSGFGGGGGGGARVDPVGVIVIRKDEVRLLSFRQGSLGKMVDLVPELIGLFAGRRERAREEGEEQGEAAARVVVEEVEEQ